MVNRRSFLRQTAGLAAAPAFIRNLISAPPSNSLRLVSFGANGMAYNTLHSIATHPSVKLACVAEVDSTRLDRVNKQYPGVKVSDDWRRLLDAEHKNLDIACVATPDHMHAPIAMIAMEMGLHVYVQKPLTHDIYEARRMQEMARKKKLVTQMGIQRHSSSEYRTAVALVHAGAIGKIKEVHSWSEKKWGDSDPVPDRSDPVPDGLNWDQWIGVAGMRPYLKGYYHPFNWRKRIDFGTATFGDMGCHIFDPVFGSLALTAPISVRSEGPPPTQHNWAINSVIHYVFPGTRYTAGKTVNITWYDGDERPPAEVQALAGPAPLPGQGSILIGTSGVMLLPHVGEVTLLPADHFRDYKIQVVEDEDHYHQFVDTVLGKSKVSAGFEYSGPLTEAVLLGPVATRFPHTTLAWNAAKPRRGHRAGAPQVSFGLGTAGLELTSALHVVRMRGHERVRRIQVHGLFAVRAEQHGNDHALGVRHRTALPLVRDFVGGFAGRSLPRSAVRLDVPAELVFVGDPVMNVIHGSRIRLQPPQFRNPVLNHAAECFHILVRILRRTKSVANLLLRKSSQFVPHPARVGARNLAPDPA